MKLKENMGNKELKKNAGKIIKKPQKIQKDSRLNRGITLIALVVTIVVLLILAGITLTLLFGENSILKTAKDAKIVQRLAEIEDEANLIYTDIKIEQYKNDPAATPNILVEEVIAKLKPSDDYKIEKIQAEGNVVTGIKLDNSTLSLAPGETKTITVIPQGNTDGNIYYVVIEGKYYRIHKVEGGIQINKKAETPSQTPTQQTVQITGLPANVEAKINGMQIELTAKQGVVEGKTTATVSYSEKTANCEITIVIKPIESNEPEAAVTFPTSYGKIDVIWLNGNSNTVANKPNAPELFTGETALKPVTWTKSGEIWNEDNETITAEKVANNTWYNYRKVDDTGTSTQDNQTSQWANVKNTDGSYFVWIPRYAYRITYYDKDWTVDNTAAVTGYYDGYGMWRAVDGVKKYNLDSGIETVDYAGEKYIVHPAFGSNVDNGGWKENLKGFWMAKYEISMETNGSHTETGIATVGNVATSSSIKAVSKPGVSSWRYINIANMYNNSYNYDRSKESHLTKNSEWGAVTYLTQSAYGRNGHEIDINNSSTFITGNGAGQPCADSSLAASGVTNAYNTALGAKASTTGNVYGVYDMSGGAYEYVAAFNKNHTGDYFTGTNYLPASGTHFAAINGRSDAYKTAYSNNTITSSGEEIYEVSKVGDGIKEAYTGKSNIGWYRDYTIFVDCNSPFFLRGGFHGDYSGAAGVFYSNLNIGGSDGAYSFRVVLCP